MNKTIGNMGFGCNVDMTAVSFLTDMIMAEFKSDADGVRDIETSITATQDTCEGIINDHLDGEAPDYFWDNMRRAEVIARDRVLAGEV